MAQNADTGGRQSFHQRSTKFPGGNHSRLRCWGVGKVGKHASVFSVADKHGTSCVSTPHKSQTLGNTCNMYCRRRIHQVGLQRCKDYIAGCPPLRTTDLPVDMIPPSPLANEMVASLANVKTADCIVANSFYALDSKAVEILRHKTPVHCVGPLIIDSHSSQLETHCSEWLDSKPARSVIYVSFGSLVTVTRGQIREIAAGLMKSGCYFMWALRPDREANHLSDMLPSGYLEECKGRGLIATWFRQAEVLKHASVGGFFSHCGWNAVMESVSAGVPMLGFPLAVDQFFNCRLMTEEWKFGLCVRMAEDGNRVIRGEEIEEKIRMLMDGEEGVRVRRDAERLRGEAEKEVSKGGGSATNFEALVDRLKAM